MNILALKDELVAAISTDPDTLVWSRAHYDRDHQVIWPGDLNDAPAESECPAVIITLLGKEAAEEKASIIHRFAIDCWVWDEPADDSPLIENNVTAHIGADRVEEFRKLVQDAIIAASPGNRWHEVLVEYDLDTRPPMRGAFMVLTIHEHLTIGEDPMA